MKILRNALIGTLIAAVPAASSIAATRPNAAVPMAGSTSTAATAAQGYDDDDGISWLVWAGVGVAVVIALILLLDNDDDDDDEVSEG